MTRQNRLKVFLRNKQKKNVFIILKEVLHLYIKKGEIPFYYFKHLYKKDVTNIFDYLGTKEANYLHFNKKLHKKEHLMIINNKLTFTIYAEKHGLKIPELLGNNFQHHFYSNNTHQKIDEITELETYFSKMMQANNVESVFVKPLMKEGGKGCFKINKTELASIIATNREALFKGDHIFSRVIKQHPEVNKIHSKAINTVRIVTFIKDDGDVEIVSSFMRFGVGDSDVDNGSSGGLFIGIDHETGKLKAYGYRAMEFGGEKLTHHPDSNFKLAGFEIPFYKEACQLTKDSLEFIPERWIGWDIAITPDGPVIIEANDTPDLHMSDVAYGGILKNPTVANLLTRIKKGQF